ncbi:sugar ABC transporter permease [Spirochaetia bacterium]|nr:sugar ABC transporter permease [Spirochaetia bacterium]GHV37805.1 sugar ABC transporter permease [Spirochaetia bacterium]
MKLELKKNWPGYALVIPSIVAVFFLSIFPLINGILLSFKRYNLVRPWDSDFNHYIWFENYIRIFTNKNFILSLGNTAVWTIANLFFQLILSMLLALALNKKMAARAVFRTLSLVPWAVPAAVAAMTFTFLFNANVGIINILFVKWGIIEKTVSWLGNVGSAMACVTFVAIWKGIPFQMIFVLAALQGIPGDIYEGAKIDGSNGWNTFWRITLPIIKQPLAIATILNSIGILTSFNIIWLMTEGGPLFTTEILYTFAYREAFINHNFGTAAAASVVLFVILAVFSGIYIKLVSSDNQA